MERLTPTDQQKIWYSAFFDANYRLTPEIVWNVYQASIDHAEKSQRDELTGLFNRSIFMDKIDNALQIAVGINEIGSVNQGIAIGFLDLDGFKEINDTYGHDSGDQVLKSVASRLQGNVRTANNDNVFRFGGDEFVIQLTGIDPDQAESRMTEITQSLSDSIRLSNGHNVSVGYSLGVTSIDSEDIIRLIALDTETRTDEVEQKLKAADLKMYEAKKQQSRTRDDRPITANKADELLKNTIEPQEYIAIG